MACGDGVCFGDSGGDALDDQAFEIVLRFAVLRKQEWME